MNPLLAKREIWRTVREYPLFMVSNKGRVKRKSMILYPGRGDHRTAPKILKARKLDKGNFTMVNLKPPYPGARHNYRIQVLVIKLVLAAFGDPNIIERKPANTQIYWCVRYFPKKNFKKRWGATLRKGNGHEKIFLPYFMYSYQAAVYRDRYIRQYGYGDIKNFRDDDNSIMGRMSRMPLDHRIK